MKIRAATPEDASAINSLSMQLGYSNVAVDTGYNRLAELLALDSNRVWVAEKNCEILGWLHAFIALRVASNDFIEIGGLVVSPNHRKLGIGKSLTHQALVWAQEKQLALRVRCNLKRQEALNFYEAIDFVKVKEQRVFEARI
jgi:N-acetylglutamate synthase-like GNAT family acetyltransferase